MYKKRNVDSCSVWRSRKEESVGWILVLCVERRVQWLPQPLDFTTWPNGLYKSRTFAKYCLLEARWEHKLICTTMPCHGFALAPKHPGHLFPPFPFFFSFPFPSFQLNLVIGTIKFDWIFLLYHPVLLLHLPLLLSSLTQTWELRDTDSRRTETDF